jgi:SAM-dependent methyltransferase
VDRQEIISRHITKAKLGIEIGAWFNGIAPKRRGYNCLILDVFDTETLRERARQDPGIPPEKVAEIEEVDLVGSATSLVDLIEAKGLTGQVDYVVSSHNIEHMPDPIRFFRGCEAVLKPGGYLSMIVPDRRCCFDYFRQVSSVASVIEAYFQQRDRPTQAQVFDQNGYASRSVANGTESIVFPMLSDPHTIEPFPRLEQVFEAWRNFVAHPHGEYQDAHCWIFTPSSFELLILDLNFLKLTQLEVDSIESADGEFYVHLRNSNGDSHLDRNAIHRKRVELLLGICNEAAITSPAMQESIRQVEDLRAQLEESRAECTRLRGEFDSAHHDLGAARRSMNLTHEALVDAKGELAENAARLRTAERSLHKVFASRSWRLTGVFRSISTAARRFRQ